MNDHDVDDLLIILKACHIQLINYFTFIPHKIQRTSGNIKSDPIHLHKHKDLHSEQHGYLFKCNGPVELHICSEWR